MKQKNDFFVQLTLTAEQARVLSDALDLFARIHIGQFHTLREQFWGKVDRPDEMEAHLLEARKCVFPELEGPGHSYGISGCPDNRGKIAWDIHQVVRHTESWARCPEGGITVNFSDPLFVSDAEPKPAAKVINVLDKLADI